VLGPSKFQQQAGLEVGIAFAERGQRLFGHRLVTLRRSPNLEDLDGRSRLGNAVAALFGKRDRPPQRAPGRARLCQVPMAAAQTGEEGDFDLAAAAGRLADDQETRLILGDGITPFGRLFGRLRGPPVLLRVVGFGHKYMVRHGSVQPRFGMPLRATPILIVKDASARARRLFVVEDEPIAVSALQNSQERPSRQGGV